MGGKEIHILSILPIVSTLQVPFHVSDIIMQVVLNKVIFLLQKRWLYDRDYSEQSPNASVVVVDDTAWISQGDPVSSQFSLQRNIRGLTRIFLVKVSGDGTSQEISKLLVRVLLAHDIVVTDSSSSFCHLLTVPLTRNSMAGMANLVLRSGIRHWFDQWRVKWSVRKVMHDR